MGLLSDLFDQVKTWFLKNIESWVKKWGQFIDNTKTYIDKSINYWGDQITNYIDNSLHYWGDVINKTFIDARKWIDNSITNIDKSIHNHITNITENITNVIGSSKEWVLNQLVDERSWTRNFFKLMDSTGFLKDPLGTIKAAFGLQRKIAEQLVVRSFWEGFEEGLAGVDEEPPTAGAGVR